MTLLFVNQGNKRRKFWNSIKGEIVELHVYGLEGAWFHGTGFPIAI